MSLGSPFEHEFCQLLGVVPTYWRDPNRPCTSSRETVAIDQTMCGTRYAHQGVGVRALPRSSGYKTEAVHFSPTWESCLVFVLSTTVNFVDSQPPVLDFPNPDGAIVRLRVHTTVRGDANNVETVTQAYRRLR